MRWRRWPILIRCWWWKTGFLKQGKSSCGVGRQYTGSASKITNCQIGVFAAYVSRHGHALIDRALYLPKAWTDNPARLAAAHVPPGVGFATKPQLATAMIRRAIAAGVPFAWVAADAVYGVGEIEMALRKTGKGHVLGVNSDQTFHSWIGKPDVSSTAEDIAKELDSSAWKRLSAGEGATAPTSPRGARQGPASRRWLLSKGGAGRSRTASRPPRPNSASTTMKPAPDTAGTAMSH